MNPAVQAAFDNAGLSTTHVSLKYSSRGTQLVASGWHPDKTPFAFASAWFQTDPVVRAREVAADLVRAHSGWPAGPTVSVQAPTQGKGTMGKLEGLAGRMSGFKQKMDQRADGLMSKIDGVERRGEVAFDKHEAVIAQTEADIAEMEKTITQITNGAPEDK